MECPRLEGILKIHPNNWIPIKKPRNSYLTKLENIYNQQLAKQLIYIEHVIHSLKIFQILSERYRNRCKHFAFQFNLITALYNF